jgi:hypothetical protein
VRSNDIVIRSGKRGGKSLETTNKVTHESHCVTTPLTMVICISCKSSMVKTKNGKSICSECGCVFEGDHIIKEPTKTKQMELF